VIQALFLRAVNAAEAMTFASALSASDAVRLLDVARLSPIVFQPNPLLSIGCQPHPVDIRKRMSRL
jgi:hypothetical protein